MNVSRVIFPFFRHPQYFLLSFGGIQVWIFATVGPSFGGSYVFLVPPLLFYMQLCSLRYYACQGFYWPVTLFGCFPEHPHSTTRSPFPASYFQMFSLAIARQAVSQILSHCLPVLRSFPASIICLASSVNGSLRYSSANLHQFVLYSLDGFLSVALLFIRATFTQMILSDLCLTDSTPLFISSFRMIPTPRAFRIIKYKLSGISMREG